jgi:diacylglycerol kinase (ATP)
MAGVTGADCDHTTKGAAGRVGHVLLLANPNSRGGAAAAGPVADRFRRAGRLVTTESFSRPSEVSPDIVARSGAVDAVVVCGGDGTMNSAAAGLIETGLPLGIIPTGTGNDLARTLSIPLDPMAAVDTILAGNLRRIDMGEVNGHPFFNVASLGLSASLAEGLTQQVKRRWGRLSYALAAAQVLVRARPFRAWIHWQGEAIRVSTFQVAVGNGKHYGGGMTVAQGASIDDASLDLYSLELTSVWKLALMLRAFRNGSHGAWAEVRTVRSGEFEVRTRRPRPVNADGELLTCTPARFRVRPGAISVFAPPP